MKKTLVLFVLIALLALSANAQVIRSSSPGATVDNLVALCTGLDGTGGAMDTISYPENGTITDVNVRTEITHTWRGDIQMHVAYSGGGGNILLAADHDGGDDNYFATFDDESANGACATVCGTGSGMCGAAPGTDCTPDAALTAFDGLASPGDWTISVCDDAGGDAGTLDLWEMQVDGTGELPVELMGFSID